MSRLVDADKYERKLMHALNASGKYTPYECGLDDAIAYLGDQPTVDAIVLPDGKPGDVLVWDNGMGYRTKHRIRAVVICEDRIRYDIPICTPDVNHPGIVGIIKKEEIEKDDKSIL